LMLLLFGNYRVERLLPGGKRVILDLNDELISGMSSISLV